MDERHNRRNTFYRCNFYWEKKKRKINEKHFWIHLYQAEGRTTMWEEEKYLVISKKEEDELIFYFCYLMCKSRKNKKFFWIIQLRRVMGAFGCSLQPWKKRRKAQQWIDVTMNRILQFILFKSNITHKPSSESTLQILRFSFKLCQATAKWDWQINGVRCKV